jgi:hypothetical protein
MSKETEIRHYNKAGDVVRPHDLNGLYVLKIVWRQPAGSGRRWSEKSGWLKADPKNKTKLTTWKELWAYKAKHARSARARV